MRILALFTSILISFVSSAQWYESQGSAYILNNDRETARTEAMENALKKALLVAGASVSSAQRVINGLLTQDELSIRASGTVNSIELIDESYQGDMLKVTIRADIFPQEQQCFAADFKKSMLVTKAQLLHREQANIGKIYNLDKKLVARFADKLGEKSRYIDIKLANKSSIPFSRYNRSFDQEKIKYLAVELGQRFDTQFVLFTEVIDVSFDGEVLNQWQFWQEDNFDRHFDTAFYIYSTDNGELLWDSHYQNKAPWTFGKRESIDLNGQSFWQSAYGRMLDRTLDDALLDIDESLMCQQTRARIVRVEGNEVIVNVGKRQGVKLGDKFSLLHLNSFTSDQGKMYTGYNVSNHMVTVSEVFQDSAVAKTTNQNLLGNIQINDLAVKQDP
ncbi:flagella assembly protein FlgT [Thalassotalea euphylliae]|uniref:Flagellar biosynthesis protein FlgT n=1 Tax=Thalassotalea euphylliae TaxID=1655234 RepID=A0A3E0U5V8_9GAMM|nr:flagella assembly protein FlgT [Thalassotalea euphylliae]REL32140.1 hypothetical protein DXX94_16205 [Thalassotalea euphylliae]